MKYFEILESLLKQESSFCDEQGNFIKEKAIAEANKYNPKLIEILLNDSAMKEEFFVETAGTHIFKIDKFMSILKNKAFLPDSYTSFQNKIGFNIANDLNNNVVLDFPYKDCYLEGGQTKEEGKRKEIFFNKILAKDQISKLLEPKVFVNSKRVTKDGETSLTEFREEDGRITDNLLIKGNNLLALHSLKKRFAGKVKLIYIDPPYNTKTNQNTFLYNNTFNRSSWLVFMKNRLEIAKDLLREDGCLIVAIDDNEQVYLGVLLQEVFNNHEHHCITIVHNPRGVIGTNFSATHEYAFFVLPKGTKTIANRKIAQEDIKFSNLRNWGDESLRTDAKNCFYPIIVKDNIIVGFGEVTEDSYHPESQTVLKDNGELWIYPIDQSRIERKWRYARQSVQDIKHLLKVKPNKDRYEIELGKDFGVYKTVWIDEKYDANTYGTQLIKSLVPSCPFKFPKSLWNVYDCLYSVCSQDKNAIILDFFGGSGTTAHAVLELNKQDEGNRKFIVVEQMDYIETVTKERIKAVLKKDDSNIDFVYTELATYNQDYIDLLGKASTTDELMNVYETIKQNALVDYLIDFKDIDRTIEEFKLLSLDEQKDFLCEILEMNLLYIPISSLEDQDYAHKISKNDIKLNKAFYKNLDGDSE